jgi:hypothetical protein
MLACLFKIYSEIFCEDIFCEQMEIFCEEISVHLCYKQMDLVIFNSCSVSSSNFIIAHYLFMGFFQFHKYLLFAYGACCYCCSLFSGVKFEIP